MKLYTLILDRSGSMSTIWNEITKTVNEHLARKAENALCSLLLFDTEGLDYVCKYEPNPTALDHQNFRPRGFTPLRDAIMFGLETLSRDWGDTLRNDGVEVEFTIFTDGGENSSEFWSSADVARAITYFQDHYGWTFTFIGAGQQTDIANYARQFGLRSENVIGYTSADQLEQAFAAV
jgi:hypothetical protein